MKKLYNKFYIVMAILFYICIIPEIICADWNELLTTICLGNLSLYIYSLETKLDKKEEEEATQKHLTNTPTPVTTNNQ